MTFARKWTAIGGTAGVALAGLLAAHWLSINRTPSLEPDPNGRRSAIKPEDDAPELPPQAFFRDMTQVAGIDFSCKNGEEANHYTLLESLGGGVALLDFDGDGLLDIFLVGGGTFSGPDDKQITGLPGRLYKNLGNWKFQDVTATVGLEGPLFYAHGCAVADYDCDGWPDLLVTGYGGLALYHNESDGKGGRRFAEVARGAGLQDSGWCTSAAWADLDGDGFPDLYLCRYVDWSWDTHMVCPPDSTIVPHDICAPMSFTAMRHLLYRNNRNGTFTEVGREAGLRQDGPRIGMGLGVVAVDVDGDGRPDIYAVNDTTENFLYLNQSSPGKFRFKDCGLESGTAQGTSGKPDGSMGVDAADYDGSGRASLWVTTFEMQRHALYRNISTDKLLLFKHDTNPAGIGVLGSSYVGFGTAFVDVDNDGWEDIVISHGHVRRHPTRGALRQKATLFMNGGNRRFVNSTVQGGPYFQVTHRGRGLAVGDIDNDGRPDLVITHLNAPATLLRNDPQPDIAHHWLGLELIGRKHRDIAGARVVVEAGGRRLTRFAKGGGSYLSASDRRVLIGLGTAPRVERVTIYWPWGGEQHWDNLAIDGYWRLVEGEVAACKPK